MSLQLIPKPRKDEYPAYADMYISLLPADGNLLQELNDNFKTVKQLILSLPQAKLLYRYAPGKWTIKEILVHIIDDERIYAYRALRFARNDRTELPGFEQDDYALASGANDRSVESIFEEYEAVRRSTIAMFNSFDKDTLLRKGIANENLTSVRALAWHIAGHELHHLRIIQQHYLQ
jgi:uncharacterized damage-inducible protein DinB